MGGFVAAVVIVARRDVTQKAGENTAVDRAVTRRGESGFILVDFIRRDAVVHRGELEILPLLQHVEQLRMHVAPLAHARVTHEVIFAEAAQAALRESVQLVVVSVPDVEQRQKIGVGVVKAAVGQVSFFARFHWALAGILNAQARSDHQDLAHRLLGAGLQNHAAHRRVNRQAGQFSAERGELARRLGGVGVERTNFLQQRIAGADGLGRRHVDEGKPLDVTETEGLHAQDHVGQVGALDLRLGEARALVEVGF